MKLFVAVCSWLVMAEGARVNQQPSPVHNNNNNNNNNYNKV
jgi:hypothetical protein